MDNEKIGGNSMFDLLNSKASAFETKLMMYIIIGVVALVIVNLLLDPVRKYIRGLDTAALGALFIFLGYKASEYELVKALTNLLYLVGGVLFALGILIFVLKTIRRAKRKARQSGPPMPKETAEPAVKTDEPKASELTLTPEEPKHEAPKSGEPKHASK